MKKKHPARLDPPLKVLSFYKNEKEEKDFGDFLYDLLNSEDKEEQKIIGSNKGIVIAVDEETDMLYMRPFMTENQEMNWLFDKLKLQLMINVEMD